MDPFEGTLLGECGRTELWIYTFNIFFNLVIRLRKVKQSAIRFCTIFSRSCCPCRPWDTSAIHLCSSEAVRNSLKVVFITRQERCWQHGIHCHGAWKAWGYMLSGVVHFLWWGWTHCAPNSYELEQPFNAHLWVWPTTVPSREYRTTLFLGTESC